MTARRKSNAKDRADKLFSLIVRSRGNCEKCGTPHNLQCAHGFSRRYRAVRWDEQNAFALCRADHMFFTHRPIEWEEWMLDRLGAEAYYALRAKALSGEVPKPDAVVVVLAERWKQIEAAA